MGIEQFNPRKFRVTIAEVGKDNGRTEYLGAKSKAIDFDDCKVIFDLLQGYESYTEKHGTTPSGKPSKLVL